MSDRKFIQRLTQELPQRVAYSWVQRGAEPDILANVESKISIDLY